jgi:hypothetical protein
MANRDARIVGCCADRSGCGGIGRFREDKIVQMDREIATPSRCAPPIAWQARLSIRGEVPAQAFARDDEFCDLGGAIADLEPDHVAELLLDWVLVRVAVMSVQQETFV